MNVEHVWIRNRTGTISASTQHLDPINYQTLLGVRILRFKYSFIPGYLSVTISEYNDIALDIRIRKNHGVEYDQKTRPAVLFKNHKMLFFSLDIFC